MPYSPAVAGVRRGFFKKSAMFDFFKKFAGIRRRTPRMAFIRGSRRLHSRNSQRSANVIAEFAQTGDPVARFYDRVRRSRPNSATRANVIVDSCDFCEYCWRTLRILRFPRFSRPTPATPATPATHATTFAEVARVAATPAIFPQCDRTAEYCESRASF